MCPVEELSEFSFTGWVYLNSQETWSRIFDFGSGTNAYMFLSPIGGSGKMTFEIKASDGRKQTVIAQGPLAKGRWHHLAVTLAQDTLTIYVDGVIKGQSTDFTLRPYDMGKTILNYIGRSQWSADPFLNGMVDDFRLCNYALSSEEINEIINSISTGIDKNELIGLRVSPTISSGQFTAFFVNTPGLIEVFDVSGHRVMTRKASDLEEELKMPANGVYVIRLTEGEFSKMIKVVKVD